MKLDLSIVNKLGYKPSQHKFLPHNFDRKSRIPIGLKRFIKGSLLTEFPPVSSQLLKVKTFLIISLTKVFFGCLFHSKENT